ncbi:MAG: serine/threonine-protein kinase [Myxococcales bacterium]|nr:serine/threonine protein kinase [Polyangiaceae bacterium]MDW8250825.1 serine/threonine-protein kinase [Myxococcales bacterium]
MEFWVGQQIDHFALVRRLGEGGQGEVWQAADLLQPGRQVALKRVIPSAGKQTDLERARREAYRLASLQHPGLVRCHKLLEPPDRLELILVMDLAEGTSLEDLLDDPRLTMGHRQALLLQIARALGALHEARIVHRDLKPANVIVGPGFWENPNDPGGIKLVDLGISVEIGNPVPLTQPDRVIGTCPYMAPEALSPSAFDPARRGPTPAVDVFAWGVLAWELLLGGHPTGLPFSGTLAEFLTAYLNARGNPAWAVNPLPPPVGPLLRDCLQLEPTQRIPDAAEIVRRLLPARMVPMLDPFTRTEEAPTPSPPPSSAVQSSSSASFPGVNHPYPHAGLPHHSLSSMAPSTSASQRPSSRWPQLIALLVLVAGLLGVTSLVGWSSLVLLTRSTRSTPPTSPDPPTPTPLPHSVTPAPLPTTPTPGLPCPCDTTKTLGGCASGRVTAQQYPCGTNLPSSSLWKLRLSFVIGPDNRSLIELDPDALVKYCVSGTSHCTTITIRVAGQRAQRCGHYYSLPVTIEDLTVRGIDVHVFDSNGVLQWSAFENKHAVLRTGALCDGMIFAPKQSSGIQKVGFFLDDP